MHLRNIGSIILLAFCTQAMRIVLFDSLNRPTGTVEAWQTVQHGYKCLPLTISMLIMNVFTRTAASHKITYKSEVYKQDP